LENLRAWYELYRAPGGPVCKYRNVASEINHLVRHINAARSAAKMKSEGSTSPRPSSQRGEGEFRWKHNALRHSFISYRLAEIQNAAQVALEAGNSPQMIFKHCRELVRPAEAKKWSAIMPEKPGNVVELKQAA
jgi:hypothetical protein